MWSIIIYNFWRKKTYYKKARKVVTKEGVKSLDKSNLNTNKKIKNNNLETQFYIASIEDSSDILSYEILCW